VWKGLSDTDSILSPFGVLTFLSERRKILARKFAANDLEKNSRAVLDAMR
jgi:hypothetical protein